MAKILQKTEEDIKKEEIEAVKKHDEDKDRQEYFEVLKKDHRFKKYIIAEIIDDKLEELGNVMNIKPTNLADMGQALAVQQLSYKNIEDIKKQIGIEA